MTMERFATEALTPDEAERAVAEKLNQELTRRLAQGGAVNAILFGDESSTQYPLPATATKLLVKVLAEIAKGNAVMVVGLKPELTVGEAAELLDISVPRLVRLLDDRDLPCYEVETQRRIRLADVLAYQRKALEDRKARLRELVTLNQEMGLYD
jgi:excisionase family DNA binding protein